MKITTDDGEIKQTETLILDAGDIIFQLSEISYGVEVKAINAAIVFGPPAEGTPHSDRVIIIKKE